jgi:NTE family protein
MVAEVSAVPGCKVDPWAHPPTVTYEELTVQFSIADRRTAVLDLLRREYFNLLLVDLRALGGDHAATVEEAMALLDAMDEVDVEERFGFHRILVLVSGPDGDRVDRLIAALGARGVGRVLRLPSGGHESFGRLVLDEAIRMMFHHRVGRRALCLAGGGITGIYFELGALKCLDDCLPSGGVNAFDMYFGISAGAVVAGILANGFSVDEFMAAIAGVEGGRMAPMNLSLLRLGHLDLRDVGRRIGRAWQQTGTALWYVLRGRSRLSLGALFPNFSDWVGPPFKSDGFEELLRRLFTSPGATNDFRELGRPLYVGATDQDARTHVLFGDPGYDRVPVSRAVQASMSANPAFSSTGIAGHYYTDGAVTRTSNFIEAIRKGADLLFIIDPFVPYVSRERGFARARGVLYNVDQDIRAISYTRFESARNVVLRRHPEVSSYTLLPANSLRRLLSVNPFDHRPYMTIWRGAYLSTLRRLMVVSHRLRGDLAAHRIALDLGRAEEVARRLQSVAVPRFADFFPGGRVELRQPALSRELRRTPAPLVPVDAETTAA